MRAIIYARLSKTDKNDTIPAQLDRCRTYCASASYDVIAELSEMDASASQYGKPRPEFTKALAMLRDGTAEALVAVNIDRLYRQPKELEELITLAESGNVTIVTLAGDYDLTTADGRMMARMLVTVAAKESDDKSRRITWKKEEQAAKGRWAGGVVPFGYTADKSTAAGLVVNDEEAEIIRGWVQGIKAGQTLTELAEQMEASGIPTRKGGPWKIETIRSVLQNATIVGKRVHIPARNSKKPGAKTTYPALWDAIISDEDQIEVMRLLRFRGGKRTPETWRKYLLTGLLYCSACDLQMSSTRLHGNVPGYRCTNCFRQIRAEKTEAVVVAMAMEAATQAKPIKKATATATYDPAPDQKRLDDLGEMFADGMISRDEFVKMTEKVRQRLADETKNDNAPDPLKGYRGTNALASAWDDFPFAKKRLVLFHLFERINIDAPVKSGATFDIGRIKPVWKY